MHYTRDIEREKISLTYLKVVILMSMLPVVFSNDHKTVTIVGKNGNEVKRTAAVTLNVSFRKDGGVTIWGDGEHKDQTVRVDAYGRTMRSKRSAK